MRLYQWLSFSCILLTAWADSKPEESTAPENGDVDIPQVEAPSNEELESFEHEDHQFMAETDRMMHIIINSLYTDRDVFVRELISNAADALEKIRLAGLQNPKLLKGSSGDIFDEYKILVKIDKEKNELSFTDTGIGMTREELAKNLGTIARSGTRSFLEAAQKGVSASNLIGQFGVGFYSAFLVADKVTVISKSPHDPDQHIWISSADGKFRIFKDNRHDKLERGTSVILTMKQDAQGYLERWQLRKIISRFSEFIGFPIFLASVKPNDDVVEWRLVNTQKPLWLRDRAEITKAEYDEFYKSYFKDSNAPFGYTHFNAEGDLEFSAIMYVPGSNRDDLRTGVVSPGDGSKIKLYVQQVLISDTLKDFMPNWLQFVRGVIHSKDLPLKVDRETFTQSRVMRVMKNKTVNKVFELLKGLSKEAEKEVEENPERISELFEQQASAHDRESANAATDALSKEFPIYSKYSSFWANFGNQVVFGCMQGSTREDKKKILQLMRAYSTKQVAATSLAGYVKRMKPGQQKIYYLTGDDIEAMKKSPYMEFFEKSDIEVLLLTGAFEEGCLAQSEKFQDYKFQSIEKNEFADDEFAFLEAGEDSEKLAEISKVMKRERKALELYYEPLTTWIGTSMPQKHAQYVILSKTLVKSPAMITSPSHGFTAAHEKLARTSLQGNQFMFAAFSKMKNFELNPHHPLIHTLLREVSSLKGEDFDSPKWTELAHTVDVLYECAMIASGFPPRRPHIIIQDVYEHISDTLTNAQKEFELKIPASIYEKIDADEKKAAQEEKTKMRALQDDDDDMDDEFEPDMFESRDEL